MGDSGVATGIAGFLQGLNGQVGPWLDQQIATRAHQTAQQETALKLAARKKIEATKATGRFDVDNPTHRAAAEYAYSIGGKPPKDLADFLAIPDAPPEVTDAITQMFGGGQANMTPGTPVGGGGSPTVQPGTVNLPPGQAPTGTGPVGGGNPLNPDVVPGGVATMNDMLGMQTPEAAIAANPPTRTPTPGQKAPIAGGGTSFADKLKPGQSVSYRIAPGFSVSFAGQSLKTKDRLALRQAANDFKNGTRPFNEIMDSLDGDLGLEFAQQVATQERDKLMANGNTDFATASAFVAKKYGATPEQFTDYLKQSSLTRERAKVETAEAGPRADARNSSNLRFAGPIADAKNESNLNYGPRIERAKVIERLTAEALLNPDERQQVGNAIGLDMTNPLTPEQENQLAGAMRMKKSADATVEAEAANAVNPQPGFLAKGAATEKADGKPTNQAILDVQTNQDVEGTRKKEQAKIDVEAENKPLDEPAVWRDPVTLEPAPTGMTRKAATEQGFVNIDKKDTGTVVNLRRLEEALIRYKQLVPKLYTTDSAFANKLNFGRLKASGDSLITELESFMPEITALSRASGDRGQSTENDISRAAAGLAKGTEFATQKGVMKAIKNTEETVATIRKTMGFKPTAGGVGSEIKTDDGVTIRRIK